MIKRLFDILTSFLALFILSPLLLLISILISLFSKGSVFFQQRRVGKDESVFLIYKFRTMKSGSHGKGLLTIGQNDPRITWIGHILRRFKLDELPQLMNVLMGDMSIVGPRPEVEKYVQLYTDKQKEVLSIRPGITDFASIKYVNESDLLSKFNDPEEQYVTVIMPNKLSLNLQYVRKHNIFLDLKIIAMTFIKILK